MPFTTAVFYDVENLLKGYSFTRKMASQISLTAILKAIRDTPRITDIALQRAYANWSDPRLAVMRDEINQFGIDPIQVFGFSREQKKNAADIQLAIDAIDIAHVRPSLEVFVIVSGDGGFASLAKKLHEYGKTVIGCAFQSATNKTFRSVCDEFVWISDFTEKPRPKPAAPRPQTPVITPATPASSPTVTDPRNVRLTAKLKPCKPTNSDVVLAKVREILTWYQSDPTCRKELSTTGIYLNVVQEAVRFVVTDFKSVRYGFAKFGEYLRLACRGTPLCVVRPPHAPAILMLRTAVRDGHEVLPDLDLQEMHSLVGYRSILANGNPIVRLPESRNLSAICHWLVENPPEQMELGHLIDLADTRFCGEIEVVAVKLGLLSILSSGAFERAPPGVKLSEQKLTLLPKMRTADRIRQQIRLTMVQKINSLLGDVREEIVEQLLGAHWPDGNGAA